MNNTTVVNLSTITTAEYLDTDDNFTGATSSPIAPDISSRFTTENFIVWFVFDIGLAIFVLFGNCLTIAAVATTHSLQTQANMYIVSLAAADMLAGFYLILDAVWVLPISGAIFDEFKSVCLLKYVVLYLCLSSSMITMISISVDKLLYLATPFLHRRVVTGEKTLIVIIVSWILSIMYGLVVCFVNQFENGLGCKMYKVLNAEFIFYGNTTPVALAVIVIAGCYIEIVRTVAKQRRKIQALNQPLDNDRDSYRKSVKLFLTVLGVFVLCWSPYVVQGFVMYLFTNHNDYHRAFLMLALLNSGLNFFIYAWKNKDFRAAFRSLLFQNCTQDNETC